MNEYTISLKGLIWVLSALQSLSFPTVTLWLVLVAAAVFDALLIYGPEKEGVEAHPKRLAFVLVLLILCSPLLAVIPSSQAMNSLISMRIAKELGVWKLTKKATACLETYIDNPTFAQSEVSL